LADALMKISCLNRIGYERGIYSGTEYKRFSSNECCDLGLLEPEAMAVSVGLHQRQGRWSDVGLPAPDGLKWSSEWNPVGQHLFPEDQGFKCTFKLREIFFAHVKAIPVQAQYFRSEHLSKGETKRIIATSGEIKVPGLDFCSVMQG